MRVSAPAPAITCKVTMSTTTGISLPMKKAPAHLEGGVRPPMAVVMHSCYSSLFDPPEISVLPKRPWGQVTNAPTWAAWLEGAFGNLRCLLIILRQAL